MRSSTTCRTLGACIFLLAGAVLFAQGVPRERPRIRPASELAGWAQWERAHEIFSKIKVPPSPPLPALEALKTFKLAQGYRIELVASEPLVANPIFLEFDPDGRIWAIEYRGYMRDLQGTGEGDPICRIVVLEDTDHDGRSDKSTVFLDGLVMPRSFAFVKDGVLVAEPPNLWLCPDGNRDLKADSKTRVGEYGHAGNPQHTANGLAYGLDNWLHSADFPRRHRLVEGKLLAEPTIHRGQFGVTFDDFGRFFSCLESCPLTVDLIPAEYAQRNPHLLRNFGRTARREFGVAIDFRGECEEVFPIRPTPAVTLGGLELRDDGTLRTYTIVAGSGIYRGDQFPPDAYGNAFVPDSAGHLIGRLVLDGDIDLQARRYYPRGQEFLASTDERFRPMSVRTGPDGALYFADMYQGIIEHVIFMVPYLEEQIRARGLDKGTDMGRIYRVVHEGRPINRRAPPLSTASSADLVEKLGYTNAWWRTTAQRLLVERNEPGAKPRLHDLIRSSSNHLARLHALWTLQGMNALSPAILLSSMADADASVRAHSIRLAEGIFRGEFQAGLLEEVDKLARDPSPQVRLQSLLTLSAMRDARARKLSIALLKENPGPLFRTAFLTGVEGREINSLNGLLEAGFLVSETEHSSLLLRRLAQCVFEKRNAEDLASLLDLANPTGWQARVVADAILSASPQDLSRVQPFALPRAPRLIHRLDNSPDHGTRLKAARLRAIFTWPGVERVEIPSQARDLNGAEQKLFEEGREVFTLACAPCHQPHGGGAPNLAPPLDGSDWVSGPAENLVRIVLHGLYGPLEVKGGSWNHHMPGFGTTVLTNDHSVAAVLTYVRRAWENRADPVTTSLVAQVRSQTVGREFPWHVSELGSNLKAPIEKPPGLIKPQADGTIVLRAKDAVCYGTRLEYRPALDMLAPWRQEQDVATWQFEAPHEGAYDIHLTIASDDLGAGDQFLIETERGRLVGTVPSTGASNHFREHSFGRINLVAGPNHLLMRAHGPLKRELVDLRQIRLVPSRD